MIRDLKTSIDQSINYPHLFWRFTHLKYFFSILFICKKHERLKKSYFYVTRWMSGRQDECNDAYATCLTTQRLALAISARSAVSSHRQLRVTRLSRFLSRLTHMRIVCLPLIVSRGTRAADVQRLVSRLASRGPHSLLNTRLTLDPRVIALSERGVAQFSVGCYFRTRRRYFISVLSTFTFSIPFNHSDS